MDKPSRPAPKSTSAPGRSQPKAPGSVASRGRPGAMPAPAPKAQAANYYNQGVRPKWYKRKYMIYPQFQMTLIILNALVTLVIFGIVAYFVVRSNLYLENLVKQTRLPAQNLFIQLLTEQLRTLLIYMMVCLALGLMVTTGLSLYLSHKIAGPMIRLRNVFKQISKDGEFPEQVKFRGGDFFQDLPVSINQAFAILKKKWQR